jgi:hypothetical protein
MAGRDTRVIGYFARISPIDVVCTDRDACVIAGSSDAMATYLGEVAPEARNATVSKTRFGDIFRGLQLGAAYAFDEESYARFYPLAQEAGLPVQRGEFDPQHGRRLFTVRLDVR